MDGIIHICNRSRAARIKRYGWSGVLTFADPVQRNVLAFHTHPHPEHLVIRCDDLDEPIPRFSPPTASQVAKVIEFGRRHPASSLLVHCNAGISRSTAAALAIIADRFGPGREEEALRTMLDLRPEAVPNLQIVRYADEQLHRQGELLRTVMDWDIPREWNQWRRKANQLVVTH